MRCLYCGKELALFKRLTGGGEFCSDAHRQKYQEEYNQLALTRLLQASPVADGAASASKSRDIKGVVENGRDYRVATVTPAREEAPVPVGLGSNGNGGNGTYHPAGNHASEDLVSDDHVPEEHAPAGYGQDDYGPLFQALNHTASGGANTAVEAEPAQLLAPPVEEEPPAAPSGFLVDTFKPHFAVASAIALSECGLVWEEKPALPSNEAIPALEAMPGFAGTIALESSVPLQDSRGNSRAPSMEMREMGRGLVNPNADFPELNITGLEATDRPMELSFAVYPAQDPAAPWEEPSLEFSPFQTELGDLARLAFVTLGWDEIASQEASAIEAPEEEKAAPEPPADVAVEVAVAEPALAASPVTDQDVDVATPAEVLEESRVSEIQTVEVEDLPVELPELQEARSDKFLTAAPEVAVEEIPLPEQPLSPQGESVGETDQPEIAPAAKEIPQEETPQVEAVDLTPEPVSQPSLPGVTQEPAESVPAAMTKPLPMTLHGHAPGRGKPVQVFPSAIARTAGIQIPRPTSLPLRPTLVFGASASPVPGTAPEKDQSSALTEPARPEPLAPPPPPPSAKKEAGKPGRQANMRPAVVGKVVQPEKVETGKTESAKVAPAAPPSTEKDKAEPSGISKPEERKAEDRKKAEDSKVAEESKKEEQKSEAKKVIPEPLIPSYDDSELGLPSLGYQPSKPGFWSKLPMFAKASVGAALLVALAGVAIYFTRHDATETEKGPSVVAAGNVLSSGGAGWDTDWAPDPASSKRQRRLSLMHASQSLSDYRMEFEGQIETKALGWVFRASNPKNFYVEKVEIVKPGLEPKIQLVRFAVIDGVEQPHQAVPLTIAVRPDTMYKVRFEAIGDRFTTWLMDQKVDEWTDSRIGSGGVGLYSESGESLSLKGGLNVVPLVVKR